MDNFGERQNGRAPGTIQRWSKNSHGWVRFALVVPTAEGEVDVYLPKSGFLGSNGYLGWSVEIDDDGVVYIVKSEDYVYGRFPNARRTTPKKERMMAIEPDGVGRWKITLNLLRQDRVKPAPATYNALFGRWYWGTVSE